MRYQKKLDIWQLNIAQRAKLQAGQWITAGIDGPTGRWAGQLASHVSVASWTRSQEDFSAKLAYYKGRKATLRERHAAYQL
jgi:hypothetical protein